VFPALKKYLIRQLFDRFMHLNHAFYYIRKMQVLPVIVYFIAGDIRIHPF